MTEYNLKSGILASEVVQEAKEKRWKVLEAVRARRKTIYTRFYMKMQAQSRAMS